MTALSMNNVGMQLVRRTMLEGSRSLVDICQSDKVNKYSVRKPVFYKRNGTTPAEYYIDTGFCDSGTTWEHIPIYVYKKPDKSTKWARRLGDFRGYDHEAPKPNLFGSGEILTGNDQDITIEYTYNSSMLAYSKLYNGVNCLGLAIKVNGGHKIVAWSYLNVNDITSENRVVSNFIYNHKVPNYNVDGEYTVDVVLVLCTGNYMEGMPPEANVAPSPVIILDELQLGINKWSTKIKVHVKPNPNDPSQWRPANVIGEDIVLGTEVKYDSFKVWSHKEVPNLTKVSIQNIIHAASGAGGIDIYYKDGLNWVIFAEKVVSPTQYITKDIAKSNISDFKITPSMR